VMLWLETTGFVSMWIVTILRALGALRDRRQRNLWLAVLLIATATTMYQQPVATVLGKLIGSVHLIDLVRHLVAVIASTALLHLVLGAANRRQRTWALFAVAAAVTVVLMAIDSTAAPHARSLPLMPEWPSLYWFTLFGYNLIAFSIIAIVCWRYWRRARQWSLRWGLLVFGVGATCSCLLWIVFISLVITRDSAILRFVPPVTGAEEILLAAGVGLPLVPAVYRWVKNERWLWALWPLWSGLVAVAPQVRLITPRSRLAGRIAAVLSPELHVYRMVIEIRDAILILSNYIAPGVSDRACLVARKISPDDSDAIITACLVEAAKRAIVHNDTYPRTVNVAELGGRDLESEIAFLCDVNQVYKSSLVKGFVEQLTPTGDLAVRLP
jgi:hypothetical protein